METFTPRNWFEVVATAAVSAAIFVMAPAPSRVSLPVVALSEPSVALVAIGRSEPESVAPFVTLPLASTVTFVQVPAVTPEAASVGLG